MRDAFAAARADAPYDVVHAQDCISANAVAPCVRTIHHLDAFTTPELVACHDAAVRDPANPLRLLPAYDSGDHLHPSDAGYASMAAAVDLRLFLPLRQSQDRQSQDR